MLRTAPRRPRPARRAPLRLLLCAAVAAWAAGGLAPVAHAQGGTPGIVLPALGDASGEDLSVVSERRLGDRIMRAIRRDPDLLDDAPLREYVESLWAPLVRAARERGDLSEELEGRFAFETFLVRDRSVNAFALPGGFVGVHLGLISLTMTPDELASVLAHELSHVTQRHIARSMGNSQRTTLVGLAAVILGIMAAARSTNVDAAQAVIAGGQAAMIQGQLNFSRDMEREADRVGYGVLVGGGFSGVGMVAMFDRLGQSSRLNDSGGFPYLRSHPLTTERVGDARARLGVADGVTPAPEAASWLHALMQGRARALMDPRDETLLRLARGTLAGPEAADTPEALTHAVAGVLAAVQLRQWPAVDAGLARLGRLAPPDAAVQRAVRQLRVEVALAREQAVTARALQGPLPDAAVPRSDLLLSARIELAGAGPRAGLSRHAERLQTWVALNPEDATAWSLLSQLQDRLGQPLAAVRAMAESRRALGDLDGAVDRLRAGQRMVGELAGGRDSIEASVIATRLKDLEVERRRAREQEQEFR